MLFHTRLIVSLINSPCLHVLIKHIFRIYALSFIYLPSYKMVTWVIFFFFVFFNYFHGKKLFINIHRCRFKHDLKFLLCLLLFDTHILADPM